MNGHRGSRGRPARRIVLDNTHDLVPEHQRLPQGKRADGAVPVVVQVRPADTAVGGPHQHLAGPGGGDGGLVDPQIPGPVRDHRFHHRPGGHGRHRTDSIPPSTYTIWPLTKSDASEDR